MNKSSSNWALRVLLASLLLLVVVFTLLVRVTYDAPTPGEELLLDRLYRLADSGNVLSATLLDEDSVVVGELCLSGPTGSPTARRCPGEVDRFHTTYPGSDVSTQQLIERLGADAAANPARWLLGLAYGSSVIATPTSESNMAVER